MKPESNDTRPANTESQGNTASAQTPKPDLRRRSFLLTASLGSAGAVAAVAVGTPLVTEVDALAPAPVKGEGYQVSDHVLQYYRSTRI